MKKICILIILCYCSSLVIGGCGVADWHTSSNNKANPCATKGASYLEQFVEQKNGTCGPIPDQIINISVDGTLDKSISCSIYSQDGCIAKDSGCDLGGGCTGTTDITFAEDGSGAHGFITISCQQENNSCTSTYEVHSVRE